MRVLIVDDEPIVRRLHEASLTGWGYQVASAASGEHPEAHLHTRA